MIDFKQHAVQRPSKKLRMQTGGQLSQIRSLLLFFIIAIFLSGVTAIPVAPELRFVLQLFSENSQAHLWLNRVLMAYNETSSQYPFLLYGYDWLAFAHFILAILFIGPYRDPVKNIWVIEFGMIACLLVFPLAFVAGHFRGIPIGWRLIDCSFGLIGFLPLWIAFTKTKIMMAESSQIHNHAKAIEKTER